MAEQAQAVITFNIESKQDEAESRRQNKPVFRDMEYIEIRTPGDRLSINHRPVEDEDRNKTYAAQYRHWKETLSAPTTGWPLKEWGAITRSQAEYLAYSGVKTVEELAGVTDGNAQLLGSGYISLVQKAKDALAAAKGQGQEAVLRHDMERQAALILALQRQVQDLAQKAQAQVSPLSIEAIPPSAPSAPQAQLAPTPAPKKRGRPAKKQEAAP